MATDSCVALAENERHLHRLAPFQVVIELAREVPCTVKTDCYRSLPTLSSRRHYRAELKPRDHAFRAVFAARQQQWVRKLALPDTV